MSISWIFASDSYNSAAKDPHLNGDNMSGASYNNWLLISDNLTEKSNSVYKGSRTLTTTILKQAMPKGTPDQAEGRIEIQCMQGLLGFRQSQKQWEGIIRAFKEIITVLNHLIYHLTKGIASLMMADITDTNILLTLIAQGNDMIIKFQWSN